MHKLTRSKNVDLFLKFEIGHKYEIIYSRFKVDHESNDYKLTFDKKLYGEFGSPLHDYNNTFFSTYDKDNNSKTSKYNRLFKAGWWLKESTYNHFCLTCDNEIYGNFMTHTENDTITKYDIYNIRMYVKTSVASKQKKISQIKVIKLLGL